MKYLKKFNEGFGLEGRNDEEDFEGQDEVSPYVSSLEDCYEMVHNKIDQDFAEFFYNSDLQDEFYEIIDSNDEITSKYTKMEEFFVNNIDEDKFDSYCKSGNLKDFAIFVVQKEVGIAQKIATNINM
jgi:hypothetical protein